MVSISVHVKRFLWRPTKAGCNTLADSVTFCYSMLCLLFLTVGEPQVIERTGRSAEVIY